MTDDTTADTGADQTPADKTPVDKQGKYYTDDALQSMFKERIKEDRASLEKQLGLSELGLQIKDVKAILAAKKKADEDAKSEVEKLTGERDQHKTEAAQAKLEAAKLLALMKAGAPADKVEALLKRVVGSTPDEIKADVAELVGLGLLAAKTPNGAQGAGNPGLPNPPKEPTLLEELEKEQAKGAGADPVKLIQLRSLIAAGAKS